MLFGRSFVAAHFSLETMMAGKMRRRLERSFRRAKGLPSRDVIIMICCGSCSRKIQPLEEKLAKDGNQPYTVRSAINYWAKRLLKWNRTWPEDLLPLFEQRSSHRSLAGRGSGEFQEYLKYYDY